MSLSTSIQHLNKGVVTDRLTRYEYILKNDVVSRRVNEKLDEFYITIYKAMPFRTGFLRQSLAVQKGDGVSQMVVTARYAIYVEQGRPKGGRRTPHPFWFGNIATMSAEIIIAVRMLFITLK